MVGMPSYILINPFSTYLPLFYRYFLFDNHVRAGDECDKTGHIITRRGRKRNLKTQHPLRS